jgi:hypothetical protein
MSAYNFGLISVILKDGMARSLNFGCPNRINGKTLDSLIFYSFCANFIREYYLI